MKYPEIKIYRTGPSYYRGFNRCYWKFSYNGQIYGNEICGRDLSDEELREQARQMFDIITSKEKK